ncbi:2-oxo acid dehydrogenase subunit E2 [Flavobacteriaceae bacterium Ap0902]|nr:2-oxo acid dehydrogenase subunit E2 [Flavobacteriaceae bacterium Ap0902]
MSDSNQPKTVEIPILLPKMGESVSEATVIEWYKKPGDFIEEDELFVLIGTDKVESELPCMYAGTLKEVLIKEKEEVAVGAAIAMIEVDAQKIDLDKITSLKPDKEESIKNKPTKPQQKSNQYKGSKNFLSPVVRKIATEHGLELEDLEKIKGTGQNGRVRKADIIKYLKTQINHATTFQAKKLNLNIEDSDTVKTLTRMQNLLAHHLQQSFMEIPHVTTFAELDVTDVYLHREEIKKAFVLEQGTKITYTHYFQYAIILALKEFPMLNAWMNVDELIIKENINIGFATSLANGDLIVPNVKKAQEMNFMEWIKAVNQKAKDAKENKLNNDDILGTTFTISNTGMFGSLAGTPIISKPQVAVIALGQILSAPGVIKVNGDEIVAVRKKMMLSISYDHRVINGAYASQFLMKVKENLKHFKDWL